MKVDECKCGAYPGGACDNGIGDARDCMDAAFVRMRTERDYLHTVVERLRAFADDSGLSPAVVWTSEQDAVYGIPPRVQSLSEFIDGIESAVNGGTP